MDTELWDEKNSTEQSTNSDNSVEQGQSGSTTDIGRTNSVESSTHITKQNVWSRKCPMCGTEKTYKYKHSYVRATELNLLCTSCCMKGRTTSDETKKKIRQKMSGVNHPHFGKPGKNLGRKFTTEHRRKISESQKGRPWPDEIREKMLTIFKSEDHKIRARRGAIKRVARERLNGSLTNRSYNPEACAFFNDLSRRLEWNLQHAENGGEVECVGYFLDAYDRERNIVVEYDESHHYNLIDGEWVLREKDVVRMNEVVKHLGCTFFRYNEQTNEWRQYA